ncbi:MAG TPA: maleylacetate reductase [Polyangiaceae bacterium]|nr:maleylacetate reductase [Polyangiaceae bacterium]
MSAPAPFVYEAHPARVVFGAGALASLAGELDRLGVARALLFAPPALAPGLRDALGPRVAAVQTEAVMHVPVALAEAARGAAARAGADGLVAVGGGSTVGLAKAVALTTGLPVVAAPTTYAGSEMTSIWGLTDGGEKRTGRDPKVRPRTVIYDPELTRSLPPAVAGPSGLNALAHAVEALYARGLDPVTALLAEEAARALAEHLPRVVAPGGPADDGALAGALYGAWLAGVCLDRAAMGLHHKLCHTLGGAFDLPHAELHAVVLPHAAAFNREAAPDAMRRLARALGADDAPAGLFALARRVGAPASLAAIGLRAGDLDRAAELATRNPYDNPRPVDREGVRALLAAAFEGRAPARPQEAP